MVMGVEKKPNKKPAKRANAPKVKQPTRSKKDKHVENMLKQKIEEVRAQLYALAREKGLSDSDVVRLSQELDQYIVWLQQLTIHHKRLV